jgi:phospholipase C
MSVKQVASSAVPRLRIGMASLALLPLIAATSLNAQQTGDDDTTTPIKHVIVIIGENRSFDHVFATYVPQPGQSVWNLLSEGIINADGTPGPNFRYAEQHTAKDAAPEPFLLSPPTTPFPNNVLPAPLVGGAERLLRKRQRPDSCSAV